MTEKIIIIDYGVGNLMSIKNMIAKAGGSALITDKANEIEIGRKFVLPGIGSFDHGISNLKGAPFFEMLQRKVLDLKAPILGVCLGVQLLFERSEEGLLAGLGWLRGSVVKFDQAKLLGNKLKVPHMGWADVSKRKSSPLLAGLYDDPRFYFVHSYHITCEHEDDILLTCNYGYEFVAGVERNNIVGVQFHPEKSHKFGLVIYKNFINNY